MVVDPKVRHRHQAPVAGIAIKAIPDLHDWFLPIYLGSDGAAVTGLLCFPAPSPCRPFGCALAQPVQLGPGLVKVVFGTLGTDAQLCSCLFQRAGTAVEGLS